MAITKSCSHHPNRTHICLISGHKGVRHEIRQGEEKNCNIQKTEIFAFYISFHF